MTKKLRYDGRNISMRVYASVSLGESVHLYPFHTSLVAFLKHSAAIFVMCHCHDHFYSIRWQRNNPELS